MRRRWTTPLIINHFQTVPSGSDAKHCLHEILAERAVKPGRAKYHVARIVRTYCPFTQRLARAVDVDWTNRIIRKVGSTFATVKDIVRRDLNQRNAIAVRLSGKTRWCSGIRGNCPRDECQSTISSC